MSSRNYVQQGLHSDLVVHVVGFEARGGVGEIGRARWRVATDDHVDDGAILQPMVAFDGGGAAA